MGFWSSLGRAILPGAGALGAATGGAGTLASLARRGAGAGANVMASPDPNRQVQQTLMNNAIGYSPMAMAWRQAQTPQQTAGQAGWGGILGAGATLRDLAQMGMEGEQPGGMGAYRPGGFKGGASSYRPW